MSKSKSHLHLSRRERQIMDVVYKLGQATASQVHEQIPEPPSYSAVRAMLAVLERKGHLRHQREGNRYVYLPTVSAARAQRSALENVLQTFFDGSTEKAVAALLDVSRDELTEDELARMSQLIAEARTEGR